MKWREPKWLEPVVFAIIAGLVIWLTYVINQADITCQWDECVIRFKR